MSNKIKPIEIRDTVFGDVEISYPNDIPFNPYPEQPFRVKLCQSEDFKGYYYFMYNGFLGFEPAKVKRKFDDDFERVSGSKESMIKRMNAYLEWVCKNYK